MTDINLKTLTPDTSLPTTGFLFGADSQASTNPSVYSTQTVATTLLGSTSLTGDTLTASAPVLDLAQTWNNGAVTFTGYRFSITDTTSGGGSLLMDIRSGGTSFFSIGKFHSSIYTGFLFGASSPGGTGDVFIGAGQLALRSIHIFGWSANSTVSTSNTALDTFLTRKGAANLRFGAADAAAPVAQTLSVQSVVAGTAGNVAGQPFTITGSQGVGSGAGGSIIFQVAPAGSTATFTVTFTNGSATINGTGLPTTAGTAVAFTTTGALPTNFAINTTYFVLAGSTSTAITVAATAGGTAIVAGSAGSGTQTLTQAVAQNALANALTIDSTRLATFGGNITVAGYIRAATSDTGFAWNGSNPYLFNGGTQIGVSSALVWFSGTTSSFPALKRSTTTLQAVLANDTGFTNIQGKLTTDTNATTGVVTPDKYLVLYDAAGTAYKVACQAV